MTDISPPLSRVRRRQAWIDRGERYGLLIAG